MAALFLPVLPAEVKVDGASNTSKITDLSRVPRTNGTHCFKFFRRLGFDFKQYTCTELRRKGFYV